MNTQDKLKVKDKRPGRFIVDDAVVDILGDYIGAYGLAVYMALARYADRHGDCYPSLRTLSRKLGVSRPTVVKTLKKLEECGLISITPRATARGDFTSNMYALLPIDPAEVLNTRIGLAGGGSSTEPPWSIC